MDKVEPYQKAIHQEQIIEWYKQWNMKGSLDLMPETGLIVPNICAIFLYETNSKVCFIDGFISNKEVSDEKRDKCLDLVVSSLLHLAKEKGFKYIKADSRYQSVIDRGIKFGFYLSPHKYQAIYKELE